MEESGQPKEDGPIDVGTRCCLLLVLLLLLV